MIVCVQKDYPAYGGATCGPVFRKVAENLMAQNMETNLAMNVDSVNSLQPLVKPGNLVAAQKSLNALGINCNTVNSNKTWGSATHKGKSYALSTENARTDIMPDMSGYGLRDAVFRLEKMGLKVKVTGCGRVVRQSIAPGTKIKKGASVSLELSNSNKKTGSHPVSPPQQSDDTHQPSAMAT